MVKAVFSTKVRPVYDDLPEYRYHFPKSYLNQVSQTVGDWIIYYEPRRSTGEENSGGGRQMYFAVAKVERIIPDPKLPDHFYAEVSNFLPFTNPVPFKEHAHYYESSLQKSDGSTNKGQFGRSVRILSTVEFDQIWLAGFGHALGTSQRERELPDRPEDPLPPLNWQADKGASYDVDVVFQQDRRIVEKLISRPFRDRAFSSAVKSAYRDTCAITGLKIINGGGRSEVQAAHIKPVADNGPDSIRNGIALSSTVHWMFDRGLISINDDFSLLVASKHLPDTINRLLGDAPKLWVPERLELRPHPKFLEYHRRTFKG